MQCNELPNLKCQRFMQVAILPLGPPQSIMGHFNWLVINQHSTWSLQFTLGPCPAHNGGGLCLFRFGCLFIITKGNKFSQNFDVWRTVECINLWANPLHTGGRTVPDCHESLLQNRIVKLLEDAMPEISTNHKPDLFCRRPCESNNVSMWFLFCATNLALPQ